MNDYDKEIEYFRQKEAELHGGFKAEDFLLLIGEFDYYNLKAKQLIHTRSDGNESYRGLVIRMLQGADCFHIIHKKLCKLYITNVLLDFFASPEGISYARDVVAKDNFDQWENRPLS